MYLLYIFSPELHFVVLTSLNHPRKILLVVLQIGKANYLSGPLRRMAGGFIGLKSLRIETSGGLLLTW
jgi:hypothetical protein